MSTRDEILANIRRGLKAGADDDARRAAVASRLRAHPANTIPARACLPQPELIRLFEEMAREASAELVELGTMEELPAAVKAILGPLGTERLVLAPAPELEEADWSGAGIRAERRVAEAGDMASLTPCFCAIAETGTLMLLSGPHSPTTLNFLPDVHLVLLRTSQIVGTYEEAWQRLRTSGAQMPRTVNLITGPSRSADIEQKLQMGAHGPRRLVILLLRDSGT